MPRVPLYALTWSRDQGLYELFTRGQVVQRFQPGDHQAWQRWLREVTSLAFHGPFGSLNVYQEARPHGGQYWYAYHTDRGGTRKHYLGRTARVTLARLEEAAQFLSNEKRLSSAPASFWQPLPEAKQQQMLLSTKLSPPRLPRSLVERGRLLAALDGALSTPLTLLAASAGWGKTTLLATWASRHPQQVAWLSLDTLDNDPFRFWTAVIVALRTRVHGVGTLAFAMLHSPQPPPFSALLTVLLNDLALVTEQAAPFLLLLDDYQVIIDPVIQETVTFWVEHLPAHVHLLLSSRIDPDLPLPRLRARGQVTEIRTAELRFRPDEVSLFLRQTMGLSLSEEEVVALERRTEGWVTGLQLAALALRQQHDPSTWIATFTGSHRYVLDYMQQEILALQPEAIQRFLLQVAVLTRMNAAACQAVTGDLASQAILETLERSNLFVVPLDSQRQWYRLHDLFREALLARVQASQPDLLPLLHIRAAGFYEAVGELREAIAHALTAPDYPLAASLMEQAAPAFWLSGEATTVQTWVLSLPDTVLRAHLLLTLDAAFHLRLLNPIGTQTVPASRQAQVERTQTRLEEMLRRRSELLLSETEVTMLERRLHLLRASVEAIAILKRSDQDRLRLLSLEIEALPQDAEMRWNAIPLQLTFWLVVFFQNEGASLIPRLLTAKQQMLEAGDRLVTINVMTGLAFAYTRAAQWHLAQQEALSALALIEQSGVHTSMVGLLYHFLFQVSYAWNHLEEAAEWLKRLARIGQDWHLMDLLVRGALLSVRLALATGVLSRAELSLHQLEVLIEQEGLTSHAPYVIACRVQWWLAEANLEEAAAWAAQLTLSPQAWNPRRKGEVLMLVHVHLARAAYAQALETLERFSGQLDRPGDTETAIDFLALHVVALHHAGKRAQAAQVAARLLEMTEPEDSMRVYLDLGPPMKQALQALLTSSHESPEQVHHAFMASRSFVAKLLAAFEIEEQQGHASPLAEPLPQPSLVLAGKRPSASPIPVASLTRREQEVLRLLAEGASNQEIAIALVIQLSTVKKHVSNLLGKLGAASRTQGIAQARTLSLL
ncbi:MAG: LuxR C-terminal-related transcriptional regulator [Ktedonobacteraceae bacterium]